MAPLCLVQGPLLQRLGPHGPRADRSHDQHLQTFGSFKGSISKQPNLTLPNLTLS